MTINEMFLLNITKLSCMDCWIWHGNRTNMGYGRIIVKGDAYYAHRLSYEFYVGSLSKENFVCHTCDIPQCVNPSHLFVGSHKDNMADMANKGRAKNQHKNKTHCVNGHSLSSDSTYVNKHGHRVCRICAYKNHHKFRNKNT